MASNLEDSVVYDCSSPNSNDLYIDLDRNEFVSEQDISYISFAHHDTGLPADESDDRTELAGLDLYSDILTSELEEKQQFSEKAFEDLQKLKTEYKSLQEKLKTVGSTLEKMEKQNIVLKYNISALYKTAKAEIERKDSNIHELRERLDGIIFRRFKRNNVVPNGHKISNRFESHKRNIECSNRDDRKNFDEAYILKKDGNEALHNLSSREQKEDTKKQMLAAFSSLSSAALKHRKHIQDRVKKLDRRYSSSLRCRSKYKNVLVETTKENLKNNKKENSSRQKKIKDDARIDSYSVKKSVSSIILNNAKNSLNTKSLNSVDRRCKQKQNSDAKCKKFESENSEKASNIKCTRKKSLNEHSDKAKGHDITKDDINTSAKCSEETGKRNDSSNLKSNFKNVLDKVIDGKSDIIVPNSKVASNKSIKNEGANGQKRKWDAAVTKYKYGDKRLHQSKDHVKMNTECRKIFSNYYQGLSNRSVETTRIKNEKNYKLTVSDTEANAKKSMSRCLKKDDDCRKNDTCHKSLVQTERKLAKVHSVTPRVLKIHRTHKKDKIHKSHKKKQEKEKHKNKHYSAHYLKAGTKMSENSKSQQIICKKKEVKYRSEGELSTTDSEG